MAQARYRHSLPLITDFRETSRGTVEPTIPVSPQAARPAVSERGIGSRRRSGVFWYARDLEIAACPRQSSRIQGSGHRRTLPRRFSAPSRSRSWEREKGAAGVMEGPGERSPRSGVRRGGAPRQPQCITLGRLAPRHYAVRCRPRCPRLARPSSAAPACGPRLPPAR